MQTPPISQAARRPVQAFLYNMATPPYAHTHARTHARTHTRTHAHAHAHAHTHTHTHYVKEIKKPEPTVDSRQTGHLSKQLVRPQQKTVSLRLGAFLRDSKNGDGSVLPPLRSHISPPVVLLHLALRRGGRCIPCTIAYMLLVRTCNIQGWGGGVWHRPRVAARSHTHMSRLLSPGPMVVDGLVVHAPIPCSSRWRHRWREDPCGIPLSRPMCPLPNP